MRAPAGVVVHVRQADRQAAGGRCAAPRRVLQSVTVGFACVEGDYIVRSASHVSWRFRLDEGRCARVVEVPLVPSARLRGRILPAPDGSASGGVDRGITGSPPLAPIEFSLAECTQSPGSPETGLFRLRVGGGETGPVQLVLSDLDGVTVLVLNAGGDPAPLVHGWLMTPAGEAAMPLASPFATRADGTAKVAAWLAPGNWVQVLLTDPDHPAAALRAAPDADGLVTVTAPPSSGSLRVLLPAGAGSAEYASMLALVSDRGGVLPFSLLAEMGLTTHTAVGALVTVLVPALASGRWQLARFSDTRAMFQFYNGGSGPAVLTSFSLPPGGSTTLDLR